MMRQMNNRAPIIVADKLVRAFRSGNELVNAVNRLSLNVNDGQLLAIAGRSGSGKTTLLNLMAGLDQPTEGKVLFEGRDLNEMADKELVDLRRKSIGFVFQSFGLLPLLSAYENVEIPMHIAGVSGRERRKKASEALELVGLTDRAKHRPFELSGGEQQRVAMARALVNNPKIVFADEPTGELDTTTADNISVMLRQIMVERGITLVVATHDTALMTKADRVVKLVDGIIVEDSYVE